MTRPIEVLVERQARRWQLFKESRRPEARKPTLTVSRQHGAGGADLARMLADELELDVYDREIIQRIAESTHLGECVVSSLDDKNRALLTDWLSALSSRDYLSPIEYRYHLSRVVGALAHHGGAVILGRGAHLILAHGEALRVLVVAPLEVRIREVMRREELSERDARRRIVSVEADRKAFLMEHFHADFADPTMFDVVVNTAELGVGGACRTVRAAVEKRPRPAPAGTLVR